MGLLDPIMRRTKKGTQSAGDVLADYFSRMSDRISGMRTNFETIELHSERAIASNNLAKTQAAKIQGLMEKELTIRNDAILAAFNELYRVIQEGGEEMSQAIGGMSTVIQDMTTANDEMGEVATLAQSGKFDAAHVQMLAEGGKLHTQSHTDTVGVFLDEVDLLVYQQALEERSERRWLELEGVFEAARRNRSNT